MSKRYQALARKRESFRYAEAQTPCTFKRSHRYIGCKTCLRAVGDRTKVIEQLKLKLQREQAH